MSASPISYFDRGFSINFQNTSGKNGEKGENDTLNSCSNADTSSGEWITRHWHSYCPAPFCKIGSLLPLSFYGTAEERKLQAPCKFISRGLNICFTVVDCPEKIFLAASHFLFIFMAIGTSLENTFCLLFEMASVAIALGRWKQLSK